MKTFLAVVGAAHCILALLGAFGVLDYHLCIKSAGDCKRTNSSAPKESP